MLLTPYPVNINEHGVEIVPQKPISAIMQGATIEIDVTNYIKPDIDYIVAQKIFPKGSVNAVLELADGIKIPLTNNGVAMSNTYSRLILVGDIPAKINILKISLKSKLTINGAGVYWKNYSK